MAGWLAGWQAGWLAVALQLLAAAASLVASLLAVALQLIVAMTSPSSILKWNSPQVLMEHAVHASGDAGFSKRWAVYARARDDELNAALDVRLAVRMLAAEETRRMEWEDVREAASRTW